MSIYHAYTQEYIADNFQQFENMMLLTEGERINTLDFMTRRAQRDTSENHEADHRSLEHRLDTLWHREQERNLIFKQRRDEW